MEFPRVVATLTAFVGDIGLAEDLAQDALFDALRQWPRDGTPRNPGAWLTTVGKRKAVDLFRRNRTLSEKYAQLGAELKHAVHCPPDEEVDFDPESQEEIADDRLRLMFVSCHPVLSVAARTALTLRLVGGLTVPEIARAYVVPEATIAQRIVRAKKTIAEAGVPFEVPTGADRATRLESVLQVIYLIYNEGYSATSGEDWLRPELCAEALRAGPGARRPGARRARGLWSPRPDGVPVVTPACPHGTVRHARPAPRPGSPHMGPPAHHSRRRRPGPRRTARRAPRPVHAAGGDRGLARPRLPPRGHRLGQRRQRSTASSHAPHRPRLSS